MVNNLVCQVINLVVVSVSECSQCSLSHLCSSTGISVNMYAFVWVREFVFLRVSMRLCAFSVCLRVYVAMQACLCGCSFYKCVRV